MQVVSIISTKGGVGKTTTAANLGGLVVDAGLRVLLLDLDVQPTLSSYYELSHRAPGGIYELLAFNEQRLPQLVSRTIIAGLDVILSNDGRGELNTMLLHAPDGRLRLRHALFGGVTATCIWEVIRHILIWFFTTLSKASVVYGPLATAVVALFSMEIAATVVLLGAQVISEYERLAKA